MRNQKFLNQEPADIEAMIKTNVHPYVYMSKYAMKHFAATKDQHKHKNAMIYVSSTAGLVFSPYFGLYSGTKTHNWYLGRLVSTACKKSSQIGKDVVDVQTLHPGAVSTNLNNHMPVSADCVPPEKCV